MDQEKFQERIIEVAKNSLKLQGIRNIEPIKIVEQRDRYFLLHCKNGNSFGKRLFLRYDEWLFCVDGLHKMPPEPERRKYTYHVRSKGQPYQPKREKTIKKEKQAETKLDKEIQRQRSASVVRKRPGR